MLPLRHVAIEKTNKVLYNRIDEEKRRANAVNFDIFSPDYGILPSAYFQKSAITNLPELFWSDDLLSLLRLCGQSEEAIGERASDYDRFLSLCRALPLLKGHPTRAWIEAALEKYFYIKELPTEKTAPAVWKMLCEKLMENPLAPKDLVSGAWLCDLLTVPNSLPEQIIPVLHANLLIDTKAKNAAAWGAEIAATVAHFSIKGCTKVVLHLPHDFDFVAPSVYHVDRALSAAKKDRESTNLLLCQLMRELCIAAQEQNLLLVLVCNHNAVALVRLLQYAEASIGLPRVCWSIQDAKEALPLLEYTAKPHRNEMFAALSYKSVMTQNELDAAVASWQVRYPVGRLCFLTACDLRQTSYAQAKIADALKKGSTKI